MKIFVSVSQPMDKPMEQTSFSPRLIQGPTWGSEGEKFLLLKRDGICFFTQNSASCIDFVTVLE